VSVTVSRLSERFIAEVAFERHVFIMDSEMVSEVAKFGELQWALFAL
jgi:hypothetical protein